MFTLDRTLFYIFPGLVAAELPDASALGPKRPPTVEQAGGYRSRYGKLLGRPS